jgi:hypothetical protein
VHTGRLIFAQLMDFLPNSGDTILIFAAVPPVSPLDDVVRDAMRPMGSAALPAAPKICMVSPEYPG